MPLAPLDERHAIRRRDGTIVPTRAGEPLYTTQAMQQLENDIVTMFQRGHNDPSVTVAASIVDQAITATPSLGADQAELVRAMCTWPDRYQCALGPAGSGKTYALAVANLRGPQPVHLNAAVCGSAA